VTYIAKIMRLREALIHSKPWLPPLLLASAEVYLIASAIFSTPITSRWSRVLVASIVAVYLVGSLLEFRWIMLVQVAKETLKGGSLSFKSLVWGVVAILLYPAIIGTIIAYKLQLDSLKPAKIVLIVLTLGAWLSLEQTRISRWLSSKLSELTINEGFVNISFKGY